MKINTEIAQNLPVEVLPKTTAVVEQKDKTKTANSKPEKKVDFDKEDLDSGIEKLNKTFQLYNKHLKFSVHKESGRVMVQVIDNATGEVIREIPPKKILDMLAKIQQFVGLLVDERA